MSLHQTPIARGYAELFAIIRATAAALPDDARAGVDLADFREWSEVEPAEIVDHYSLHNIPGRSWCESLQSIARPQVALHGPRADWGLILVRYELDGARGSFKVTNSRAALLRLAEKIGTLPGGRAVLRAEKPAKPRPAVSWPAVSVKVWREQLEDGAAADALALGIGKLGGRVYQQGGRAAYMIVAPVPIDGMPDGFATGRRDDGKWCGFDTQSGLSIGCQYGAHGSRASAEKAALSYWQNSDEFKRAQVLAQARAAAADADQAAALAEWCKARGLDPFEAPADDGAPVLADDAPAAAAVADPADLAEHAPADDPAAAPVDAAAPASAPAAPIDAPAARPVVYRFPLILVGTDSHRITETMHDCAGPGLTSADIAAADVAMRTIAAARGLRVVETGFSSGAARAWCEALQAPAAPDPAPAAPAAGQTAPAAIVRAAEALARISADWAPDAGRSHAMAGGRAGLSEHLPRILADLRRAASHGFGLEKTEARRALAEFDAAAPAGAPAAPAAAAPRQSAPVLPLFARIALDRLQCSADLRSPAQLAELLSDYARIHGTRCDDETAAAVLAQCAARWPDQFNPAAADPAPAADPGPAAGAAPADAAAGPAAPADVDPAELAEVKAAAGADDAAAPMGAPYPGNKNATGPDAIPDPAGALPAPGAICGLILHNVTVPIVNAAAGGPLDPAALLAEAARVETSGRRILADCAGLPTEAHARQTLADSLEVARRLRAMLPADPAPTPCPGIPDGAPWPAEHPGYDVQRSAAHDDGGPRPCTVTMGAGPLLVTRGRAAYLLRAGRSRSRGNVTRAGLHAYRVTDARLTIDTARAPALQDPAALAELVAARRARAADDAEKQPERSRAFWLTSQAIDCEQWARVAGARQSAEAATYAEAGRILRADAAALAEPAADPAPWRDADGAAARARVHAVHVRTAAAAQAMAPTWHADGARLRRSVNAPGFDSQSLALRAALAAQLRADRAAARLAAEVARVVAVADKLHLPAADLRARAAHMRSSCTYGQAPGQAHAAAGQFLQRARVYDAAADALAAAAAAPGHVVHPLTAARAKLAELRAELIDETRTGRPDGFLQMLIDANEKTAAQLAAAFAVFDAIGDGCELANTDGRRFCVLLPDASEPGRYRYSVFDAAGFSTHHTEDTAAAAVADAAGQGFTIGAAGVLDRLAAAPEWARGMAVADVIQRQAGGRLSWQDAHAELARINAEHAPAVAAQVAADAPAAGPVLAEPEPVADAPADAGPTPYRVILDTAPAGQDAAADVCPIAWQVLAARPTAVYCTPVYRIGVHEWCMVVYAHDVYASSTDHLWRRVDQNRGRFHVSRDWPTYNSHDGTYGGMPRSLCARVFEPNRAAIESAHARLESGQAPSWAPAATLQALQAGLAATAQTEATMAEIRARNAARQAAADGAPCRAISEAAAPAAAPVAEPAPVDLVAVALDHLQAIGWTASRYPRTVCREWPGVGPLGTVITPDGTRRLFIGADDAGRLRATLGDDVICSQSAATSPDDARRRAANLAEDVADWVKAKQRANGYRPPVADDEPEPAAEPVASVANIEPAGDADAASVFGADVWADWLRQPAPHAAAPEAAPVASVADTVAQCFGTDTRPETLADLQAANETAATLAGAIDAAATGADAVRLLRSEAARVRLAADGQPVRVAARYLVASAMLAALALRRAADLAEPAGLPAGQVPIKPARILRAAQHLQPGARRAAPVAAGGAGAIDRPSPTCYPWRTACTAGQLARPPPGR